MFVWHQVIILCRFSDVKLLCEKSVCLLEQLGKLRMYTRQNRTDLGPSSMDLTHACIGCS